MVRYVRYGAAQRGMARLYAIRCGVGRLDVRVELLKRCISRVFNDRSNYSRPECRKGNPTPSATGTLTLRSTPVQRTTTRRGGVESGGTGSLRLEERQLPVSDEGIDALFPNVYL